MRRLVTGLLLVLALVLPAAADKAKSLYDKGKQAELHQDYEAAYNYYHQAWQLKPNEVQYQASADRMRFAAAAAHVHRGQQLRTAGKLTDALAEFEKAASLDPSLPIAQQELNSTREQIRKATQPAAPPQSKAPSQNDLGQIAAEAAGPVELKAISPAPITLKMTEDTKVIYTTIGKLAGINVLFDPDYVSRRISIDLNGVTLYQALEVVALESKTFYRPVTPNTIMVAADTRAKRTEIEQSVVKTFYLSNLSATTELQDVVNTLRTILEVTRVLPLPSQGAIVVRGTPDQVALAEKLIDDIDKAKPEVIIEVAVMQVSRDKIRDLGINPPQTASIALQPNINTTSTPTTPTVPGTTTPSTGTGSTPTGSITLNQLANLNATDFTVTIPQASVSFLFSDNNTRIIQNPQIRALDGQKASLKIGDRVPVATGSFQPGIGGVGINPLVNTQFQYIDVGVNIDITPHVHPDGDVSLKVTLEVSSVTSHVSIGGIDQPVIGQRRVDHDIRLKEGEVNLLGGMLEEDTIKNLSGYPWLSQVPILKYLFSETHQELAQNEVVFALVPHVVRRQDLNDLNLRALDVGTANAIDLRRGTPAVEPAAVTTRQPAGGAAPAPPTMAAPGVAAPAPPVTGAAGSPPPAQPTSSAQVFPAQTPAASQAPAPANLSTASAVLSFDPPAINQSAGSTFTVNVAVSGANNLYSVPAMINYDPKTLQLVNVSNGGFLSQDGQPVALVHRDDPATGTLQVTATRPPGVQGVSGRGMVFTLTFLAKAGGQSTLSITRATARDPQMQVIPVSAGQAMVNIK